MDTTLEIGGAQHYRAIASGIVTELQDATGAHFVAGVRLAIDDPVVLCGMKVLLPIASAARPGTRPVRAILFDKSVHRNWTVPWHQDRTIAVHSRVDVPGFGPWSLKDEMQHVEPPFALLADMLTLRLHIDACAMDNAPLEVALGSHRQRIAAGRASEAARSHQQLTCLAAAGDIWAYATPILHRSARAERPSRRRVLQIDFSAAELPGPLEWLR